MLLLTLGVVIWQIVYWYPQLPDVIPSHFDSQGNVDGEMAKTPFFVLMTCLNALFLIGFPLLGKLLSKLPDSLINLPNKEYWLAPERRESTVAQTTNFLAAIGWITSWLMIGIIQLSALVAIGSRETINPESGVLIGVYVVAIFGMVAWLFWSYRIPKEADALRQTA